MVTMKLAVLNQSVNTFYSTQTGSVLKQPRFLEKKSYSNQFLNFCSEIWF